MKGSIADRKKVITLVRLFVLCGKLMLGCEWDSDPQQDLVSLQLYLPAKMQRGSTPAAVDWPAICSGGD